MAKSTTVFAKGTIYWAKVIGDQALVPNFDKNGKEWTIEFEPDDPSFLKEHGLLDRLKDPLAYADKLEREGNSEKAAAQREFSAGRGDYLVIRKPELTKDGKKNDPFRIYDQDSMPWEDALIGNGSKADFKLKITDWGPGKKKSIYATAIRITDHVEYESDEFAAMDREEGSGGKAATSKPKAKASKSDNFDDDVPF